MSSSVSPGCFGSWALAVPSTDLEVGVINTSIANSFTATISIYGRP